jgi:methionine-rich copper-binding protein CopC
MRRRRATPAILLPVLVVLFLLPGIAAAHSELETSDPADGATLTVPPAEISGEFSEEVDAARSSMELRGPGGARIATGGVPAGGPPTRMTIAALPTLAPGVYEVRWTTVTADDDGIERGTFSFTVAEALPTATSAPGANAAPTAAAAPAASATAAPTPVPGASPSPDAVPAAGVSDMLLPVVTLVAVVAAGAVVLLRRRR